MGIVKKIIVFEDKLEEIFSYLPRMKYNITSDSDYKVVFGAVIKKLLMFFLKRKIKEIVLIH